MAIQAGARLGFYEVSGSIGAGGMGEVYRARDTRLGRDVALKTLPPAFAEDPERMARFEREAQVLASLNHPHIAAIYGLEDDAGVRALVMELVEGPTLADRMAAGPLPQDEALRAARQIADALEYAHERGIVHRDLKPANVKVTPDGTVKVLDFGLAKATQAEGDTTSAANSPTLTMRATQAGVILGTAAYMSPEQASGKPVDRRSDIWAFGVVLWEMLTGRRLFDGETVSHTLADVLRSDISLKALPPSTPPAIQTLVGRCLDRDVKSRLRDIGEARVAIDQHLANPGAGSVPAATTEAPPPVRRAVLPWVLAAASSVAALGLAALHFREAPVAEVPVRFSVPPQPKSSVSGVDMLELSPDGRYLAFTAAAAGGANMLWIRSLDSLEARQVPGTEGAYFPFWSPDSRSLVFATRGGRLLKAAVDGSPVVTLNQSDNTHFGGTWSPNGVILTGRFNGPLRQLPEAGGEAEPVLALDQARGESGQLWPQFLPDGKRFLYLSRSSQAGKSGVYVGTLGSKDAKRVLDGDTRAWYSATGHLMFVRQDTLMAQAFDPATLALAGQPFPVADEVGRNDFGGVFFTTSEHGTLAYRSGGSADWTLNVMDRAGKPLATVGPPGDYAQLTLSPDGRRLIVDRRTPGTPGYDLWMLEVSTGVLSRVTFDAGNDRDAVFSPDGRQIVFSSDRAGEPHLYRKTLGAGPEELLFQAPGRQIPEAWTRDGSILFGNQNGREYRVLSVASPGQPAPVYRGEFTMDEPAVSPDGRWVAYGSTESGRWEVYTARFPSFDERRQISPAGGSQPHWRQDGREIVYLTTEGTIVSVDVTPGATIDTSPPVVLFSTRLRPNAASAGSVERFAMSPDATKFYVAEPVQEGDRPMTVVLHWPALFRR